MSVLMEEAVGLTEHRAAGWLTQQNVTQTMKSLTS